MIPTSDGSRAKALFASMDPQAAAALRAAIVAAIARSSSLTAEVAVVAKARNLDMVHEVQRNVLPIENTSLDAAADVLAQHSAPVSSIGAALAAGAAGAMAAGVSVGKVRGELYHAGSMLGDAEALASGNPRKIVRRGMQHVFWRAFGKAGRSIFRGIGGKR